MRYTILLMHIKCSFLNDITVLHFIIRYNIFIRFIETILCEYLLIILNGSPLHIVYYTRVQCIEPYKLYRVYVVYTRNTSAFGRDNIILFYWREFLSHTVHRIDRFNTATYYYNIPIMYYYVIYIIWTTRKLCCSQIRHVCTCTEL